MKWGDHLFCLWKCWHKIQEDIMNSGGNYYSMQTKTNGKLLQMLMIVIIIIIRKQQGRICMISQYNDCSNKWYLFLLELSTIFHSNAWRREFGIRTSLSMVMLMFWSAGTESVHWCLRQLWYHWPGTEIRETWPDRVQAYCCLSLQGQQPLETECGALQEGQTLQGNGTQKEQRALSFFLEMLLFCI